MQKVEGSNPFSRFKKGLHLQAFSVLRPARTQNRIVAKALAGSRAGGMSRRSPAFEPGREVRQVLLEVPERDRHGAILWHPWLGSPI